MNLLRPNAQRAKITIQLLYCVLAVSVIAIVSNCVEYEMLIKLYNGDDVSDEAIEANDIRQLVISVLYAITYITCSICFIQWFHRAYYNMSQKRNNLPYSKGWTVGGWFVPIMSLYIPYVIMRQLWQYADELLVCKLDGYIPKRTVTLVATWWFFFISKGLVDAFSGRYLLSADDSIDSLLFINQLDNISAALTIIAALVTIAMIRQYAEMEGKLLAVYEQETANNLPLS